MAKLVYDGNSKFGVAVRLANRRSLVNVTAEMPFELGNELTESEIRYYKSLKGCNIKLVGDVKIKEVEKVNEVEDTEDDIVENVVEEVEEVNEGEDTEDEVSAIIEDEVSEEEEVTPEEKQPTPEEVYNDLVEKLSGDEIKELCYKVGFTSKKRNASKKLWDLLFSDKFEEVLKLI